MSSVLRGSNDVTLPCFLLGHCSNKYTIKVFQDIRVLKINLSISSDSKLTSIRINLESNEQCKCKVEQYNIWWISGSSAWRKVLKLSNIGITDMVYRSLTSCFNAFTNLFSQIGLSPGFLLGSSTKSKLDTKYDFKETTISVFFSKHFPRLNHILETIDYFPNFFIVKVHELLQLFSALLQNNEILNIYRKLFGSLSSTQMC